MGVVVSKKGKNGKKTQKKSKNVSLFEQKDKKLKKKLKNVSFYCVFSVKIPRAQASLLHSRYTNIFQC